MHIEDELKISKADIEDLQEILNLQYLAYQSEAALFGSRDIPPLKQTLDEVIEEYHKGIILKLVDTDNLIIGSIRAWEMKGTIYIGKLMIHPNYRQRGYGTKLLSEIEKYYPQKRYELFTSTRSIDNIRLYQRMGYRVFGHRRVDDKLEFVYLEKKQMLQLAIKKAQQEFGAKKITLGVFDNNPSALHCYESVGFVVIGTDGYQIDGEEWSGKEMELEIKNKL